MTSEKIKQLWEISKEQEQELIKSLFPKGFITQIELDSDKIKEVFKLIRGAEYRRGKEDGIEIARKEFLDKINKISVVNNADILKDVRNFKAELKASLSQNRTGEERGSALVGSADNQSCSDTYCQDGENRKVEQSPLYVAPDNPCKICGACKSNHPFYYFDTQRRVHDVCTDYEVKA